VSVDVLLVEDDQRLAELTSRYLQQNGLSVSIECRGDEAMARFNAERPRLVLLDLMLPGKDGLTICRELRATFSGPILILTAKDADIDQVIGLEAGADDYVAKPIDPIVLLARIRALLRRAEGSREPRSGAAAGEISIGSLRLSTGSRQAWLDDTEIALTTHEFELLSLLALHAGTILSRDEIYKRMRGIEYDGLDRSIDGRISKLRRKLGDDPLAPRRIRTIWGKGYLLAPDAW
jgi:DNA-binding response OmpR family regulator